MGEIRPKRRKHRDNPYVLIKTDDKGLYIVSFKDGIGITRIVEVTKEVYEAFDRFELDDLRELNEYDNHIEHSEIYENNLNERAKDKPLSIEDEIIKKSTFEELKNAIDTLPDIQKRRIKKYYFADKNVYEIAKEENTTHQAISKSINNALETLKNILKK